MGSLRVALWFSTAFALALPVAAQNKEIIDGREVAANEVLVKFRSGSPNGGRGLRPALASQHDIRGARSLGRTGLVQMRSGTKSAARLLKELSAEADVLYAEPNYIIHAVNAPSATPPNDPGFAAQWDLDNSGQNGGTPVADIDAARAWGITTGSPSIVVGVVDSGIDYTHPDLAANVWSAPSDYTITFGPGDSVDCPAGSHGYDATRNTCDPMDQFWHGTHVAGTIAASGNNATGVAGVNWTGSLLGLRFLDANGDGTVAGAVRAIEFAIQLKAAFPAEANVRVLSNSWSGQGFSQAELDAINAANAADILFVAAAGNRSNNLDTAPEYPAAYNALNLITVAATDRTDSLAGFSNYSASLAHLGAPGVEILSATTSPAGGYALADGTSMAAPHVAGAAALVLSVCTLDTAGLKQALLNNVDPDPALAANTITGGRLNVYRAILDCTGQPASPSFTVSASGSPLTIPTGTSASSTISVAGSGGFRGSVALGINALPAGVTAVFSPATVAPGGTSTLNLGAAASAPASNSTLTISGTRGNVSGTTTLDLSVTASSGFILSPAPASLSLTPAAPVKTTVSVQAFGGFQGNVALSLTGLPPNVTAKFTPAVVAAGGSATLTLTAGASAAQSVSAVTVTGTSGNRNNTTWLALTVSPSPGFVLGTGASPSTLAVVAGSSVTSTIGVTPAGGFNGKVTLSLAGLPPGVTASLSPLAITPATTATLTLTAAAYAPTFNGSLIVSGASGYLSARTALTLNVSSGPGFTLRATPSSLALTVGSPATSTVTVTPFGGFNGNVALSLPGLPSTVTAAFNPATVTPGGTSTLTLTASAAVTVSLNLSGTSGNLSSRTPLRVAASPALGFKLNVAPSPLKLVPGSSTSATVSVLPAGGFNGNVTLAASGLPPGVTASFNPATIAPTATSRVTLAASGAATGGSITITGTSGVLSASTHLDLNAAAGFALSAAPSVLAVTAGSSVTTTVSVAGSGGFAGNVTLAMTGLAPGVTASFNPPSAAPGGTSTLTLSASASAGASANVSAITGSAGYLTGRTPLTLTVTAAPAFRISAAPYLASVTAGASVSTTISVTPSGGFNNSVTLAINADPGLMASFSPTVLAPGSTATLTFSPSATYPAGTHTFIVVGTSGNVTRAAVVSLAVSSPPGFTLTAAPSSLTLKAGYSVTSTVNVRAVGGFAGNITFGASGLPAGVTAVFSPPTAAPGIAVRLILSASASAAGGTVTVTGTSGSLTGTATVDLRTNQ